MTQQLIPFDLAKAIAGHPLVTRDGRKVTEFKFFDTANADGYNCVFVIDGRLFYRRKDGRWDGTDSDYDLFLAPTEVTRWQNIYQKEDREYFTDGFLWTTESSAKACSKGEQAIATVPVTFSTWKP
jgi:hypothetical protein